MAEKNEENGEKKTSKAAAWGKKAFLLLLPFLAGIYGIVVSLVAEIPTFHNHSVPARLLSNALEVLFIGITLAALIILLPKSFPQMKNYSFGREKKGVLAAIALCTPMYIIVKYGLIYFVTCFFKSPEMQAYSYTEEMLREELLTAGSTVLLAPVYEELIFRVLPLSVYKKKRTKIVVAILMSLLFAVLHGNNWIAVATDALLYSALFLGFKNVSVNICAHVCNNLFVTVLAVLSFFGVKAKMTKEMPTIILMPWPIIVVSAVMAGTGVFLLARMCRKRNR